MARSTKKVDYSTMTMAGAMGTMAGATAGKPARASGEPQLCQRAGTQAQASLATCPGQGRHRQHGKPRRTAYLAQISLEKCAPARRSHVLATLCSQNEIRSAGLRETADNASTVSQGVRGQGRGHFDRVAARCTASELEAGAATRAARTAPVEPEARRCCQDARIGFFGAQ